MGGLGGPSSVPETDSPGILFFISGMEKWGHMGFDRIGEAEDIAFLRRVVGDGQRESVFTTVAAVVSVYL